jgi:hypothetical protein
MNETYLVQANLSLAQERSAQQAAALGCDQVFTRYWWAIMPLKDGTAAVVIQPGTPFDVTASTKTKPTSGLTTQEQSGLKTATEIQPLLPTLATVSVT